MRFNNALTLRNTSFVQTVKSNRAAFLIIGLITGLAIIFVTDFSQSFIDGYFESDIVRNYSVFSVLLFIPGVLAALLILLNPFIGLLIYTLFFLLPPGLPAGIICFAFTSLVWFIKFLSTQKSDRKPLVRSPLYLLLIGLYSLGFLVTILVDGALENFLMEPNPTLGVIFYSFSSVVIFNMIDSKEKMNAIIWVAAIVGISLGLLCAFQFFSDVPAFFGKGMTRVTTVIDTAEGEYSRAGGTASDGPTTSFVFISLAFLCLPGVWFEKGKIVKAFFIAAFIIMISGVLFTLSRAGWIAFGLAYAYWWWKKGRNLKILVISLLIFLILAIPYYDKILDRIYVTYYGLTEEMQRPETLIPLAKWKRFFDHPIVGTGFGRVNLFAGTRDYFEEQGLSYTVDPTADENIAEQDAYSQDQSYGTRKIVYIDIGNEIGLFGLLLFFLIIIYTWLNLSRVERYSKLSASPYLSNLALGLKTTLVGQGIFCLRNAPSYKVLWFTIGLCWAISSLLKEESKKGEQE